MTIFSSVIDKFYKIGVLLLFCSSLFSFGQGASLSPYDLKESYVEKKQSFKQASTKTISATNQAELDRIVNVLEVNAPTSYEYHLVKYLNGNFDLSLKEHLFKAYALKPDEREVKLALFGYYTLVGDTQKQKEFARQIKNYYSANQRNYYKQMMQGVSADFVVFSGQADAFPVLVLQSLGEINRDVQIINLDFLQNDAYRKKIQTKVGGVNATFIGNEAGFVKALLSAKSASLFVSSTVHQSYLGSAASSCYLTGLTYQMNPTNQRESLEKFWKNAQSYLANIKLETRTEKALYGNYLPPFLTLYKLKLTEGEKDSVLRSRILLLAEKVNRKEAVMNIIKAYEQNE